MNYVPLNQKQEQSSSSPISFHNSSTFYINQQKPVLNLPKPRFNLTVSGHHPRPTHDFSRSTIQTPEIRPPRTPIPFSTIMPVTRTDNPLNNVQQKLAALTLRLEKELESETTVGEYYGQCTKCNQPITGSSSDACQAMGELYHNNCFKCVLCAQILRGKAFYRIHDQVYCEEDYLVRTKTSSICSRWDTFVLF
jgi:LIM domain-containing protein